VPKFQQVRTATAAPATANPNNVDVFSLANFPGPLLDNGKMQTSDFVHAPPGVPWLQIPSNAKKRARITGSTRNSKHDWQLLSYYGDYRRRELHISPA